MKILIIGGDSKIISSLLPMLNEHEVTRTTRREQKEGTIFLDLSRNDYSYLGDFDCVVIAACNFKKGRSDEDQMKCTEENVYGIITAINRVSFKKIVFLSSYLAERDTAYGRQKREIEKYISSMNSVSLRIGKVESEHDCKAVVEEILKSINGNQTGIVNVL